MFPEPLLEEQDAEPEQALALQIVIPLEPEERNRIKDNMLALGVIILPLCSVGVALGGSATALENKAEYAIPFINSLAALLMVSGANCLARLKRASGTTKNIINKLTLASGLFTALSSSSLVTHESFIAVPDIKLR